MSERVLPRARTYLGYTLRPYIAGVRWEVVGEFEPRPGGIVSVGIADIRTLAEAKKAAREFEREHGRAVWRKPSP